MTRYLEPEWRNSPAVTAVVSVFEKEGFDLGRFAGGSCRDGVLGKSCNDIDIATVLTPEKVTEIFEQAGFQVIPTGILHGTVSVVSHGQVFEITTCRKDKITDGRHAEVEFTDDWQIDSARRDFRANSLYLTFGGEVIDFFGGIEDITAGRIVFVGDPRKRIQEDYLRILRFYRFHAIYGRTFMDPESAACCNYYKFGLEQISAERITVELLKMLASPNRDMLQNVVQTMHYNGTLAQVIPNYRNIRRFYKLVHKVNDPILLLASMLPNFEAKVIETGNKMRLSADQTKRMAKSVIENGKAMMSVDPIDIRKNAYKLGVQAYCDQMMLLWASDGELDYQDVIEYVKSWPIPKRPVNGADLIELGYSTGKELGNMLKYLEDKWIESDFQMNKHELLTLIEETK